MSMNARELGDALQLPAIDGPGSAAAAAIGERPWYIGFMLGASGWVAGLFVLLFVGLLFKPNSQGAFLLSGLVLVGAAWGLYKADREGAFVAQLALALSVAGQVLLVIGLAHDHAKPAGIAFIAFVLQSILVLIMPNALHRTLSALFACAALAIAMRYGLFAEASGYRFNAANDSGPSLSYALAGWALTWLPVATLIYWLIRHEARWMARGWQAMVRPALAGLVVGLAVATLASHPLDVFSWSNQNAAKTNWLALWPLLSAIAAVGAVAAGFALRSRALMGIGIVAAVLHLGNFYYTLGTTLLLKSLVMLVMGAVLLGIAYALKRRGESA